MRKILMYIIVVALAICTYLSVSYAYYSTTIGTNQNIETNIAIDACITLTVTNQINLTGDKAVPITDAHALTNTDYRSAFTVYNNCSTAQNVEIAFAPGSANTMPVNAIKYAIYEQGATVPSSGTALSTNKIRLYDRVISEASLTGAVIEYGYLLGNTVTIAANSSKSYYLNTWIDNSEGGGGNNSTINKEVRLHLLAAVEGQLGAPPLLSEWLAESAPKSGTDAVSSSPWILTSDRTGEWRYAGKNPDNYIQFNGELWRIIGVMPNMDYCTGAYGNTNECNTTATGSLVKIIRNQTISSSTMSWDYKQTGVGSSTLDYGSNDWSDSQLMLMLNGTNYLKTGYDVNGNKLHQSYTITSNVVKGNGYNYYNATYSYLDGNGTTVNIPSSATTSAYTATSGTLYKKIESTALNQIATVKWDLYGTNSYTTAAEGSPSAFYNKERNINGLGAVYTNASLSENRAVYWYGKIGLMYLSDYGYATNGNGAASGTYSRNGCLGTEMNNWDLTDYCYENDWMYYVNATASSVGTSVTYQWTLNPYSGNAYNVFAVVGGGYVGFGTAHGARGVRPVLYLKAETGFGGGNGTYNNPYTIE